jgi:hypothetical protein
MKMHYIKLLILSLIIISCADGFSGVGGSDAKLSSQKKTSTVKYGEEDKSILKVKESIVIFPESFKDKKPKKRSNIKDLHPESFDVERLKKHNNTKRSYEIRWP